MCWGWAASPPFPAMCLTFHPGVPPVYECGPPVLWGPCVNLSSTHSPPATPPAGTLHPNCQDSSGRPRRDIGTILQILNDLLSATRHYQGMPPSLTQLRCHAQCTPASPAPDLTPKTTSCDKLAATAPASLSQARMCKPLGKCPAHPTRPWAAQGLSVRRSEQLTRRGGGGAAAAAHHALHETGEKGACVLGAQSVLVLPGGGTSSPPPHLVQMAGGASVNGRV